MEIQLASIHTFAPFGRNGSGRIYRRVFGGCTSEEAIVRISLAFSRDGQTLGWVFFFFLVIVSV